MDCHKQEPCSTDMGSDAAFFPVLAFLHVKSFFGNIVWATIFINKPNYFKIQNLCSRFWLQTIFQCYICILFFIKQEKKIEKKNERKPPQYIFPYCPIHCFLGNVISPLNTYTVCSLDLLCPQEVIYPICTYIRIYTEIVMNYLSFMHHQP